MERSRVQAGLRRFLAMIASSPGHGRGRHVHGGSLGSQPPPGRHLLADQSRISVTCLIPSASQEVRTLEIDIR